ncbi:MAG: hypothetical protein IPL32_01495 [Chloracidobacterium sp.]|nr:hypothetical protein [Chloracidobacterium sp.]
MFKEDRSVGRVSDFIRPANFFEKCESWDGKEVEMSTIRHLDYRRRFLILGLSAGIEGYCEKESVYFYASTKGLSVTGSSKGYVYTVKQPTLLVDDLDKYWSPDGQSFAAHRHIEGQWYLFLDYED